MRVDLSLFGYEKCSWTPVNSQAVHMKPDNVRGLEGRHESVIKGISEKQYRNDVRKYNRPQISLELRSKRPT